MNKILFTEDNIMHSSVDRVYKDNLEKNVFRYVDLWSCSSREKKLLAKASNGGQLSQVVHYRMKLYIAIEVRGGASVGDVMKLQL